jgi:hypothetical protein
MLQESHQTAQLDPKHWNPRTTLFKLQTFSQDLWLASNFVLQNGTKTRNEGAVAPRYAEKTGSEQQRHP